MVLQPPALNPGHVLIILNHTFQDTLQYFYDLILRNPPK